MAVSLGSPYSRPGDPEALAPRNLIRGEIGDLRD